jgi:aspartokinase
MPLHLLSSFVENTDVDRGGTTIMGVNSTALDPIEGPKVFTIATQRNLALAQKKLSALSDSVDFSQKVLDAGLRPAFWSQNLDVVTLLFEESQWPLLEKIFVPERKVGSLVRVTLIGVGLSHAPDLQAKLSKILESNDLQVVIKSVSPTSLELVVEDGPQVDEFVRQAHKAFI